MTNILVIGNTGNTDELPIESDFVESAKFRTFSGYYPDVVIVRPDIDSGLAADITDYLLDVGYKSYKNTKNARYKSGSEYYSK